MDISTLEREELIELQGRQMAEMERAKMFAANINGPFAQDIMQTLEQCVKNCETTMLDAASWDQFNQLRGQRDAMKMFAAQIQMFATEAMTARLSGYLQEISDALEEKTNGEK